MSEPGDQERHASSIQPVRDLPAVAERVLIIGLDGATWDVLDPLIERGLMPNLRALVGGGTSGVLHSTTPPITPAAWTTFMTGKSPGTHGIIDFERYDVRTNKLSLNSTRCLDHVRKGVWLKLYYSSVYHSSLYCRIKEIFSSLCSNYDGRPLLEGICTPDRNVCQF